MRRVRSETPLAPKYGPEWEVHVLANLPMWTVLLPLFLDQSLARVSSCGDAALSDLLSVHCPFLSIGSGAACSCPLLQR